MNTLPPTIETKDLDDDRDTRRVGYGIVLALMDLLAGGDRLPAAITSTIA